MTEPTQPHQQARPDATAVVEEALRKASIAWITVAGAPATAAWCLGVDGVLHVVCGPGEQRLPGLADGVAAQVTLRGDHGGQIVTWTASASRIGPDDPGWAVAAPQLAAKRLNVSGPADQLVGRWARECAIFRLSPTGAAATGAELPRGSGSEAPRPTPAARPTRKPFRLHRVRGA
ncbi:hypothetical protein [Pilimelia columellifera]|uniref:Pyridoxamine 5'-phosphate oxidase putative domain-containing protein n=1 Tax=Pilimelia columellifera subsp. columellifera TaxID=706583 RepID=A0ABN3NFT0_9ACTN